MPSWLNTTASMKHTTPIPTSISFSKAVRILHSHEAHIQCDPHMIKYEPITPTSDVTATVPNDRQVTVTGEAAYYTVTDRLQTLPAGIWDSDVESTYEFISLESGIFVRIRSPLNVVMETVWGIRETGDGRIEMVEDVLIKASRLLVGTVKSMCNTGWKGIHERLLSKMEEDGS